MSRFFYGSSDSESSSSDEEDVLSGREEDEEESSEEESSDEEVSAEEESDDEETGANKFLKGALESDESEDEEKVTVVKSAKDKRLEGLENTIRLIENAEKINDWVVISSGEFGFEIFESNQC